MWQRYHTWWSPPRTRWPPSDSVPLVLNSGSKKWIYKIDFQMFNLKKVAKTSHIVVSPTHCSPRAQSPTGLEPLEEEKMHKIDFWFFILKNVAKISHLVVSLLLPPVLCSFPLVLSQSWESHRKVTAILLQENTKSFLAYQLEVSRPRGPLHFK